MWSILLPSLCTPHWPSLTILYTWQNFMQLISMSTIVLIKDQNGSYIASTIFPTYHFNIYPILIQIPCTLYYKPYLTSTFFLIFISKKYFLSYIFTHVTSKTNTQCLLPQGVFLVLHRDLWITIAIDELDNILIGMCTIRHEAFEVGILYTTFFMRLLISLYMIYWTFVSSDYMSYTAMVMTL